MTIAAVRNMTEEQREKFGIVALGSFLFLTMASVIAFAIFMFATHGGFSSAEGRVVKHRFTPAHTAYDPGDIWGGGIGAYHVKARYEVLVESDDHYAEFWVTVPKPLYKKLRNGSHYSGSIDAVHQRWQTPSR